MIKDRATERRILKKFLHFLQVKHEKWHILSTIDIDVNATEDDMLTEIMLNIIGFPDDNSQKFSDEFQKYYLKEEDIPDNMFCTDWLTNTIYDYLEGNSEFKNDDQMIDWLYKQYDEYINEL